MTFKKLGFLILAALAILFSTSPSWSKNNVNMKAPWDNLPCLGYFNNEYRQALLQRIDMLAQTQGNIIVFVGDSLTQMWTDSTANLTMPTCGSATQSGLVAWTGLPAVKLNLGLYGITDCTYLREYMQYFAPRMQPYASRVKVVVINLGTNDIIQNANNPYAQPQLQIQYIQQMIDQMSAQFPNAHFLIQSISPCLNTACGEASVRALRVSTYNNTLYAQLNGYKNITVMNYMPIQPSDLTPDQVHYNTCAYRIVAHNVNFWATYWLGNSYTYPASLPICFAATPIYPCDVT